MSTGFIPSGYEPPKQEGGFTKLETGSTKLRILSNPLMMWVSWEGGKPTRSKYDKDAKPRKGSGEKDSVKHAWAMVVYNYNTKRIEVFELDKQTVIKSLITYAQDEDWGHPKQYDIQIDKSGSGRDGTEYKLICKPKKPISEEILQASKEIDIDLTQLLVQGGNCFGEKKKNNTASNEEVDNSEKNVSESNPEIGGSLPF